MELQALVKAVIGLKHGWAVADQFEDTFNGEALEKQNLNALRYIKTSVEELISSRLLNQEAQEELIEYREGLTVYLS